eukprot:3768363-Pleurochrysis_carterae.AAC.4
MRQRSGDGGRAEEGREFLCRGTQGTLREGDSRRGVCSGDVGDVGIDPQRSMLSVQVMWSGDVAAIGRVLQYVVPAGRVCRAEEQAGAPDEFVRAVKLGAVAAGHVGHAGRLAA